MRRLTKSELNLVANRVYIAWVSTYGLTNAKRLCAEIKKRLITESKRRKELDGR